MQKIIKILKTQEYTRIYKNIIVKQNARCTYIMAFRICNSICHGSCHAKMKIENK